MRGWRKEERRGIFQTFNWTVLAAALCIQIASGLVKPDLIWLVLIAFPGNGHRRVARRQDLSRLNDRNFGDVVLGLLFLSGIGLVWSSIAPR